MVNQGARAAQSASVPWSLVAQGWAGHFLLWEEALRGGGLQGSPAPRGALQAEDRRRGKVVSLDGESSHVYLSRKPDLPSPGEGK